MDDSARRKGQPVITGNLRYFSDAHLAVAELSRYGNDKHNPGEPLHWSKDKSNDHADCCGRHLLEPFGIDLSYGPDKPVLHSVAAAWRALANAQIEIDTLKAKGEWPLKPADPQVPAANGWREWKGGERPVPANKMVQVRFRDDYVSQPVEAGDLWWDHRGGMGDIIAWRRA
jgi:hypothetical protein